MKILLAFTLWGVIKIFLIMIGVIFLLFALLLIFIIIDPPKEYHYEEIESETWLKSDE
jgi:cell division protein FtsL